MSTFKIEVLPLNKIIEVDTSQKASVLDVLLENDIEIDHACGGVAACSTCHIYVKKGFSDCSLSQEDEEDMLDKAPGVSPFSRLACQCIPNGKENLVIEIPKWNRNLVKEGR